MRFAGVRRRRKLLQARCRPAIIILFDDGCGGDGSADGQGRKYFRVFRVPGIGIGSAKKALGKRLAAVRYGKKTTNRREAVRYSQERDILAMFSFQKVVRMEPEHISAMADGNVSEEDCVHLTPDDMALLDTYQLVGDLIRAAEPVTVLSAGFADRFAKRLAQETPHSPSRSEMG